jgi:hypothetical protein
MIATVPQRLGFVVALHYLSRRYWPDPDDPIPSKPNPCGLASKQEEALPN